MKVIVAIVLGVISLVTLLGMSVAAITVNVSEPYGETFEVVDGNPNSVRQSSEDATSLLQPADVE